MLLSPGQKVSNSDMHLLDMVSTEEIIKLKAICFVRTKPRIPRLILTVICAINAGFITLNQNNFTHV